MNLGQKIGLGMIIAAIGFPAIFMGITLWREWTNTWCEGECATGWYFVISVWLGIPTLMFGAFVFGIASMVRANKESNNSNS
jgi:hypothetical protein